MGVAVLLGTYSYPNLPSPVESGAAKQPMDQLSLLKILYPNSQIPKYSGMEISTRFSRVTAHTSFCSPKLWSAQQCSSREKRLEDLSSRSHKESSKIVETLDVCACPHHPYLIPSSYRVPMERLPRRHSFQDGQSTLQVGIPQTLVSSPTSKGRI